MYDNFFLSNNFHRGHPMWNSNIFTLPVTVDGVTYENIVILHYYKEEY
jgi:hypothetical protein